MYAEAEKESLADLVKENASLEAAIQSIQADYKQTTSMFIHELRNPLALLKSTLQYIETTHPEALAFKYWGQLQELVHDMEIMMSDASQLNTCTSIQKENHNLLALFQAIMNNFMPQAVDQQIDLMMEVEEGCEAYFSSYPCDAVKLKQVFGNLIKNAFEATAPGDFIHISTQYLPRVGDILPKLSIRICNNGLPIPADQLENIFLPFVTYKKGGTGVGLAIVKKIVELHYGSIHVTSDENQTCFTILLPL